MKNKILGIVSITLIITINVLPIIYIISHSLKGEIIIEHLYQTQGVDIWDKTFIKPFYISFQQYYQIFIRTPEFLYLFWNGIKIVVPIVMFQLLIAIFSAYGFSKLKFPGSETLFFVYINMMLMPFQVTLVPNYIVLMKLQLIGSHLSIILPGVFGTFGVFFLKQFMEGVSDAFIEEAKIGGASDLQILWQIMVPMCKPIIMATGVLLFVDYWNMVEQPILFLSDANKYPLSVYLGTIADQNIGIVFACSSVFMILPILLSIYIQEDLTESLRFTNLK